MECEDDIGNPWLSFSVEARLPIKCSTKIIDNRFPNNFKKFSSIVTCNVCQILLLKSQTLYHFRNLHNKKLRKKRSQFIIPYNAIEAYDLIREHKTKQLLVNKKSNGCNKSVDLFQLKRSKFDAKNSKKSTKFSSKLDKSLENATKTPQNKTKNQSDKIVNEESIVQIKLEPFNNIAFESHQQLSSDVIRSENRVPIEKSSSKVELDSRGKLNDLKLNIKVHSNGTLTSSMKTESNIFDRISNLCENSVTNASSATKGPVKQLRVDQSFGCTVFTDEHNNSILIDNDKDDPDDIDCCESSVSNDSAYYSLPNTTTANTLSAPAMRKSSTFCDSGGAPPPLVTAYQFSGGSNRISCQHQHQHGGSGGGGIGSIGSSGAPGTQKVSNKPSSATMVVSRNSTKSTDSCAKSNVKHRFYVSGHSNQNMLNSIRQSSMNVSYPQAEGSLTDGIEHDADSCHGGVLHNIPTENRDFLNLDNNPVSVINKQLNFTGLSTPENRDISSNSLNKYDNRAFIRQSLLHNSYWDCIQERGIKSNLLIPKRLSWNYITSRFKAIPHYYSRKLKYSSDIIVHPPSLNPITSHASISNKPLLPSFERESTGNDNYLQPELSNTSGIMLDYPFLDRNQMSFQQRLLERGVISQRDIARSQRYLSLNNQTLIRKNVKSNSNKQVTMDCKKMSTYKTSSLKNQIMSHNGDEIGASPQYVVNKSNYAYVDPALKDSYKSRSTILLTDSSLLQISNTPLNSGITAQNMLSNDTICLSQPLARKYINHTIHNSINRYNGCSQKLVNHSTNVIHTNFDR